MHDLTCMDCGAGVRAHTRLAKVRCAQCRVEYKRREARVYARRKRAEGLAERPATREITCGECAVTWHATWTTRAATRCPPCRAANVRRLGANWYARHGDRMREIKNPEYHRRRLLRSWAAAEVADQIEETLPASCEACGSSWRLCLDHNHGTGLYRGRLCHACNATLGLVDESLSTLSALINYLEVRGACRKGRN